MADGLKHGFGKGLGGQFAQLITHDFAAGRLRKSVDDRHRKRGIFSSDVPPAEVAHVLGRTVRPGRATMKAATSSPYLREGTPTTCTS